MKSYVRALSPMLEVEVDCEIVRSIPASRIQAAYKKEYGYDSAREFEGAETIWLLKCPQSELLFFYPFSIAGREELYKRLQTFDWNYKEVKWEHDRALQALTPKQRVLDVGCGEGAFLYRSHVERDSIPTGLEFNSEAAKAGRERGIEVFTDSIEAHARERSGYYDVVTSFQVLEHVSEPAAFLRACIAALRPGGSLLVGVPNNDSFLGQLEDNWLNMPPHHMTLWSQASLEGLAKQFGVQHAATWTEPLQELGWYQSSYERRFLAGKWRRRLYYRLGFDRFVRQWISEAAPTILGHTVLAHFIK